VLNSGCNRAPKKICSELLIAINRLKKLVKRCKREKETSRMKEEQREVEQEVERINQKTETSIVIAGTIWSEQLQEELSRWWTILKGKLVAENNTTSKVEIRECIDRRCEIIKDN